MAAPAIVLTAHDIFLGAAPLSGTQANVAASADMLSQTVEAIRKLGYLFVSFERFMAEKRNGGVALLTFDDAYTSILRHALPILAAVTIPAVVFVCTGAMRGVADPFPIWLQELRDNRDELRLSNALTTPLEHPLICRVVEMSGARTLFEILSWPLGSCTEAFRNALTQQELDATAEHFAKTYGLQRMTMTEAEVRGLLGVRSIELGAHSVTHRSFADLSTREIEIEVTQSTAAIAEFCGKPMASIPFAYPYGGVTLHAERVVSKTCRAGFTCQSRPVSGLDRDSALPRINLDSSALRQVKGGGPVASALASASERAMLNLRASPIRKIVRAFRGVQRHSALTT